MPVPKWQFSARLPCRTKSWMALHGDSIRHCGPWEPGHLLDTQSHVYYSMTIRQPGDLLAWGIARIVSRDSLEAMRHRNPETSRPTAPYHSLLGGARSRTIKGRQSAGWRANRAWSSCLAGLSVPERPSGTELILRVACAMYLFPLRQLSVLARCTINKMQLLRWCVRK